MFCHVNKACVCVWALTCGRVEVGSGSGWCCSAWRPVWGWSCTRPPWWSLCHEPSFRRLDMRRRSFTGIQQRAVRRSSFRAAQRTQEFSRRHRPGRAAARPRHTAVCAHTDELHHTRRTTVSDARPFNTRRWKFYCWMNQIQKQASATTLNTHVIS